MTVLAAKTPNCSFDYRLRFAQRQLELLQLPQNLWMDVMETLCGEMGATQQLSVLREKLDDISAA